MSTNPTESLWTARQVAAHLQLSLSWVRHATAEGRLPFIQLGHNVRFEPVAIRAWLTKQQHQPARVVPILRASSENSTHG